MPVTHRMMQKRDSCCTKLLETTATCVRDRETHPKRCCKFGAETKADFSNPIESYPGNWNKYRVPSNTTGHLILYWLYRQADGSKYPVRIAKTLLYWNFIECVLLLQKHTICEITRLIDKNGVFFFQKRMHVYHMHALAALNLNRFSWDRACRKAKMVDYRFHRQILAIGKLQICSSGTSRNWVSVYSMCSF